jgi:nitrate reductase gamma subunit
MTIPHWFLVAGLAIFTILTAGMLRKAVPAWRSYDPSRPKGKPVSGAIYSLTGAMLPWKKESARLYPASYIIGVLYHTGTFIAFAWVALLAFNIGLPEVLDSVSVLFLAVTAGCGVALLAKRIASSDLRYFSSPDDYFSNLLVTGWQGVTLLTLLNRDMLSALLVCTGVLLLYIPFGKLRHAIYLIPARVYLGLFYGRRGVWPAKDRQSWQA